jgi:hypothetical protein
MATVFPCTASLLLVGVSQGQDLMKTLGLETLDQLKKNTRQEIQNIPQETFLRDGEHGNAFAGSDRTMWNLH